MFPIYIILLCVLLLSSPTYSSNFTCSLEGECENKELTCNPDQPCYVQCSANWACRGTTVRCPKGQECYIKCYYESAEPISTNGQMICQHMTIDATESSLLIINAAVGHTPDFPFPRTLQQAVILCPTDYHLINSEPDNSIDRVKPCQIHCDGDDVITKNTIYAMQGMNDLFITATNYSKPWCFRHNILLCGEDYNIECPLKNKQPFDCSDPLTSTVDQTCETYVVSSTSTSTPISSSQTIDSLISTTNQPTVSSETGNPTQTPTRPPSTDSGETNTTDADELELAPDKGLSDGEMIIAILLPIFCCALILMSIGFWMLKKRKRDNQTGSIDKRGRHKKIDGDDGTGHIVKEKSENGHTGIDVGFDHNPEIYGKENNMMGGNEDSTDDDDDDDDDYDDSKSDILHSDS